MPARKTAWMNQTDFDDNYLWVLFYGPNTDDKYLRQKLNLASLLK